MHREIRLLHEGLIASAERHRDKTALIVGDRHYSYGELLEQARSVAGVLRHHGVQRGDRVAIFMDNGWSCAVAIYATLLAGGVILVINPQTKAEKLRYILADSGARLLLTERRLEAIHREACACLEGITALSADGGEAPVIDLRQAQNGCPPLAEPVATIPNDLAALIYTSGSTGEPKGVMQTHLSMVFAHHSIIEYLELTERDRIFLALPLAFDYGLYQLLMAVRVGATLIVERSFTYPGQIYQRLKALEPTVFPAVPTIFSMMIASHRGNPLAFPSIETVTNTAATLAPELLPALREIFPNARIFKMYGLTECKRVSYLDPEELERRPASVGKAIPGTEAFILDEQGRPVPPGEVGTLHVRGPHIMAGYWNAPQLSREMLKPGPLPNEKMLCTRDLFRMDEEGFLYFVARSDEIIKTRGEKVSPAEVEQVLLRHESVSEAAVTAIEDPVLGQAIVAVVVANGKGIDERGLKRHCTVHLENFMVPRHLVEVDELPKTANGKIDKGALAPLLRHLVEEPGPRCNAT